MGGGGKFQPPPPGSISHYPENWPNGDLNFNYAYILISRVNLDAPRYINAWNHFGIIVYVILMSICILKCAQWYTNYSYNLAAIYLIPAECILHKLLRFIPPMVVVKYHEYANFRWVQ